MFRSMLVGGLTGNNSEVGGFNIHTFSQIQEIEATRRRRVKSAGDGMNRILLHVTRKYLVLI